MRLFCLLYANDNKNEVISRAGEKEGRGRGAEGEAAAAAVFICFAFSVANNLRNNLTLNKSANLINL